MLLIFLFFFLSRQYQSCRVIRIGNNIMLLDLVWYCFFLQFNLTEQWKSPCYQTLKQYHVAGLGMLLIFIFLFCHATIRVAVLLELETISCCWTWYGTVFFCIFTLTEQWESPCYQTIKQYLVAGLGMLLIFIFLFYHATIRVAVLLDFGTISSCWIGYCTDFFLHFNLTAQWESPCYQTLKQYHVAGLGMLLIFIFHFCHATIRVAVLLDFGTISCCWTWYGTDFFLHF